MRLTEVAQIRVNSGPGASPRTARQAFRAATGSVRACWPWATDLIEGERSGQAAGDAVDLDRVEEPPLLDDEDAALRELATCLAPMLRQLAPAYQEAVRIVDLEGVTQQEAARRAGVSLSGMKSRVQRGRQQLRAVLEACCRIDLDHRGSISGYAARHPDACGCGGCGDR